MASKFEIYKDKAGGFRFRLKAGNGENILASQGYKSKNAAINSVHAVMRNAIKDNRFEKKETKAGKFLFNIKASNNHVIGTSQSYSNKYARDNGAKTVQTIAPSAEIIDIAGAYPDSESKHDRKNILEVKPNDYVTVIYNGKTIKVRGKDLKISSENNQVENQK